MKMTFGKYGPDRYPPDGVDIVFINSGYLKWLMKEGWFIERDDDLVLAIEGELRFRDQNNAHFDDDKVIRKRWRGRKITRRHV